MKLKKYWKLFITMFYISSFTFGGGFVIISIMRKKFVNDLKWIDEKEMTDLAAIAQSSPGAIAINTAILLGYKIGGVLGVLIAVLGTVLPPFIVIYALSFAYDAFRENEIVAAALSAMQAAIAAIICDVAIKMGAGVVREKNIISIIIMPVAFIVVFFFNDSVIYIILACIAIAVTTALLRKKKGINI